MDPAIFRELRNRAKRLLRDYEESSTAFLKEKQSREAFVELGAEVFHRSELRIPKKVTRAFGSSASLDWQHSEQYKNLTENIEKLVREVEETFRLLKGRQPSLRVVHQAVKPDTKLKHLAGALTTAEGYASASRHQKKRKRVSRRKPSPDTEGTREERERGLKLSQVQTLMGIGVTAMLGFAALGIGLGLELPLVVLFTMAGTIIVVWLTDELLRRA